VIEIEKFNDNDHHTHEGLPGTTWEPFSFKQTEV